MTAGRSALLKISTAPFLHEGMTTRRVMYEVLFALLPVVIAAVYFFGLTALLTILSASLGAMITERVTSRDTSGLGTLADGSALITGVLLALTLPPSFPLWMSFLGGVVSIGLGKSIWGGLGQNLFNPALVGRAFLQAAFPTAITTWTSPQQGLWSLDASNLAMPLMKGEVDGVTSATPLGLAKFEGELTPLEPLLFGNTSGSLGETSALVLLVVGAWLAARRIFDWRLVVSTLGTVAAFSALLHAIDPQAYPGALFMLTSGGLLFAAVFMVTDPVTTPVTPKGMWIFGAGAGVLVVLIRLWGGLPEGVMYGVLLMNAVTPLINRYTQPEPFGGAPA
ncbi:MAG: RnfABCDGE type electron transport complex subunit D [Myxococcota bacterium]